MMVEVAGMLGGMGDGPLWSGRQDMGYGGSLMGDGWFGKKKKKARMT